MLQWCQERLQVAGKEQLLPEPHLEKLRCSFERLEGLFLIARRLVASLSALPRQCGPALDSAPAQIVIPSVEIFVDFSSLIYHGASTLDVLAAFVRRETGVAEGKFRGLKNAIYNTQPADLRADALWNDLDLFERSIENIFTEHDGHKGLRNFIAHENSVLGLSAYAFEYLWRCSQTLASARRSMLGRAR